MSYIFNAPKNFTKGKLIFSKYKIIDLIILILSAISSISLIVITLIKEFDYVSGVFITIGLFIIVAAYTLTFPFNIYHNVYNFLKIVINKKIRKDKYIFKGVIYK